MKVTEFVVPFGVVTVTFLAETVALVAIVKVVFRVVPSGDTVIGPTVTPVPDTFTAVAPFSSAPVRVIPKFVLPRTPDVGLIVANDGPSTVKVTAGLAAVPFGVTTVTLLADKVAVEVIVNVAMTVVSLTTPTPLTVTPVPDTFTADAPVSPVPVMVTFTDVPR